MNPENEPLSAFEAKLLPWADDVLRRVAGLHGAETLSVAEAHLAHLVSGARRLYQVGVRHVALFILGSLHGWVDTWPKAAQERLARAPLPQGRLDELEPGREPEGVPEGVPEDLDEKVCLEDFYGLSHERAHPSAREVVEELARLSTIPTHVMLAREVKIIRDRLDRRGRAAKKRPLKRGGADALSVLFQGVSEATKWATGMRGLEPDPDFVHRIIRPVLEEMVRAWTGLGAEGQRTVLEEDEL